MRTSDFIVALVFENSKVIVLCLLIGSMILLSHFGRKPRQPETRE
jgi:hypothetical protein